MRRLKIQNLILIEKAEIEFGKGLNILTGETGSGKSAILSAIRLIGGERADSSCIRKGAEVAIVEAEFEEGPLIRREIYRSGKNRCFIDDALVNVTQLKESVSIERVDQNSSILSQETALLDQFATLAEEVEEFSKSQSEEKALFSELEALLSIPKERELEWAQKDLELIETARWKEEEALNQEHLLLSHAQELSEKIAGVSHVLTDSIPALRKALASLETCGRFDAKIQTTAQALKGALLEFDEAHRFVESYLDRLEANPIKLETIEKEIGAILNLKRRFGADLEAQKQKLLSGIERLSNIEFQVETLQNALKILREKNFAWKKSILEKRQRAAPLFANLILQELKDLNMPDAQFEVAVSESAQFLFSANRGNPPIPIAKCCSGGELSRLLLAIKTVLSSGTSTLVFDEIDSNVGGQTAAAIGEKLQRLSQNRQVICVTHFVQVAKYAMDHFLVSKETRDENTYTTLKKLIGNEREPEYNRMLGNIG